MHLELTLLSLNLSVGCLNCTEGILGFIWVPGKIGGEGYCVAGKIKKYINYSSVDRVLGLTWV